jgi:3-deoxy-D-manno-octulosonic-acid transferase
MFARYLEMSAALKRRNNFLRILYTLLFYLILPFVFLRLLWRSRQIPGYRQRWAERLGYCPYRLEKCIWVHAVSVGETIAAVPLIKVLLKEFPHLPLVVTNMTPTGAARVKAAFSDKVLQVYIPYDLPGAVGRFLARINPQVGVIMETELWPNLLAACAQAHIPLVIANARLSEKSAKGYASIAGLTREMFLAIHSLAAQAQADAERFIALGLTTEKITVTGNLKFDLEPPSDLLASSEVLRNQLGKERLIWVAASTHPGEEEIVLAAHRLIIAKNPTALLILVPRHPNRFPTVAGMLEQQKFNVTKRSSGHACSAQTNVYLGDTMGELLLMYAAADVAFVAGSFAQVGGHNMLEPAVLHKPVITGPILFNFAEISQLLLDAQGMFVAQNAEELAAQVERFFADSLYRNRVGENAYKVVAANRGALMKQLQLITAILNV